MTLGRVGGGATAILALAANNTIAALSSDASNTTTVALNGNVLTLAPTSASTSAFGGSIVDGSATGGSIVKTGIGMASLSGVDTFTGGVTIDAGALMLGDAQAAGTGAITFGSNADAALDIGLGDTPTNQIDGFAIGDAIDLLGVGTETTFTYMGGVLNLSGGSQAVQLDVVAPPSHEGFVLASDGSGGTLVTLAADAGPTINPETPSAVEVNRTTVIGTVTAGLAGDVLTLTQTGGAGALSLGGAVDGVQQVIYTAPAAIAASMVDSVSYTVADQYNDTSSGSAAVQLDAGPVVASVTPAVVEEGQPTVIGTVTAGIIGDTLTLTPTGGAGSLSLGTAANGVQQVIYTAPPAIAASAVDSVSYTIADQHNDVVAFGSSSIQLDAGPKAGSTSITVGADQALNETALVDSLITPGLAGDQETIVSVGGNATLSGQTVTYDSPASGTDNFTYTVEDQLGGTATGTVMVTIDAGPVITSKTPALVENGQSTVIATVASGLAADTLELAQTGGSGTVSLQLLNGVEEVIYTAPASVAAGMLDNVSYAISDQYNDTATGSSTVPVAPAPDAIDVGTAGGSLNVGNGNSAVDGRAGNEKIQVGNGNDVVFAGTNDTIQLGNGNDTVLGGSNDTIQAGNGTDTISTGAHGNVTVGNNPDTVTVGDSSTVSLGNGQDTVTAGASATISGGNGQDSGHRRRCQCQDHARWQRQRHRDGGIGQHDHARQRQRYGQPRSRQQRHAGQRQQHGARGRRRRRLGRKWAESAGRGSE